MICLQEKLAEEKPEPPSATAGSGTPKATGGKYVPPSLRDGASKGRGESMSTQRKGQLYHVDAFTLSVFVKLRVQFQTMGNKMLESLLRFHLLLCFFF